MFQGTDRVGNFIANSENAKRFYYTDDDTKMRAMEKAVNTVTGRSATVKVSLTDIVNERSIFLTDDYWDNAFNNYTSDSFISQLIDFDQENNDPINVFINSNGGMVQSLYAIISAIKGVKSPVNTVCLGNAASCGAVLLSAGKKRYCGKHSMVMIHDVSTMTWGSLTEMEKQLEEVNRMNNELIDIMVEKTGQENTVLRELMRSDFYMNAEEAADLGLVDGILDVEEDEEGEYTNEIRKHASMSSGRVLECKMIDILSQKKKGESVMDFKQMCDELKFKYNVDVMDLQNRLKAADEKMKEAEVKFEEAEKRAEEAEASKAAAEEAVKAAEEIAEDKEIENLLENLIRDGKSTQVMNDEVYRPLFKSKGIKASKDLVEKLPRMMKTEAKADTKSSNEDATAGKLINEVYAEVEKRGLERNAKNYYDVYNDMVRKGMI